MPKTTKKCPATLYPCPKGRCSCPPRKGKPLKGAGCAFCNTPKLRAILSRPNYCENCGTIWPRPGDPEGDKRRTHSDHPGIGAITPDCIKCNPLVDDATFLSAALPVVWAAINVMFAAAKNNSVAGDHPWLLVRDEIQRRRNALKPKNEAEATTWAILHGKDPNAPGGVRVRSITKADAVSCTGCGCDRARSVVEVGRPAYGPTELRLCADCLIALDGALATHQLSGIRGGNRSRSSGA